jgi:hypothetical protein
MKKRGRRERELRKRIHALSPLPTEEREED